MMKIPVLMFLTVLRSVSCRVCDTQLAKESYACSQGIEKLPGQGYNCSFFYMQDKCYPAKNWGTQNKSCQQFTLKKENHVVIGTIVWKGARKQNVTDVVDDPSIGEKEDMSIYDKNAFLWYCAKDDDYDIPPALQQAMVLIDIGDSEYPHKPIPQGAAGNISTKLTKIYVKVSMANSFANAESKIYLQNGEFKRADGFTSQYRNLMGNFTREYCVIHLTSRDTLFTVLVIQDGFRTRTFEYRVTNTDLKNDGQNTMGNYFFLVLTLFWTM